MPSGIDMPSGIVILSAAKDLLLAFVVAFAFLAVIPAGNLLLPRSRTIQVPRVRIFGPGLPLPLRQHHPKAPHPRRQPTNQLPT